MSRKSRIITLSVAACATLALCFAGAYHMHQRSVAMRSALDAALEQNCSYVPFTTDSVMKQVVAYYTHPLHFWTTANDRLRAHYVLGCVYRDLHDAPIALLAWEDAVAAADTTAADCDFATLFRVYGQMADVYNQQHLPSKQLETQEKYNYYALRAGDTLSYIRGKELLVYTYYALGDTASVFLATNQARELYLKHGFREAAEQVYPTAIRVAVNHGLYERALDMMGIYEQKSGLFDDEGILTDTSRVQYYYDKGACLLALGNADSAELCFRRLLPFETHHAEACNGLMGVFYSKEEPDSLFKYSQLYNLAMGKLQDNTATAAIIQAESLYDYERAEKEMRIQQQRVTRERFIYVASISLVFIIVLMGFWSYRRERRMRESRFRQLAEEYSQALHDKEQKEAELALLQKNLRLTEESDKILEEKRMSIKRIERKLREYERRESGLKEGEILSKVMGSNAVILFRQMTTPKLIPGTSVPQIPTAREWDMLTDTIIQLMPHFYATLIAADLTPQEYRIAILARIDFSNKEIATLLDTTASRISTSKSSINKKLFNQTGTKSFLLNLKRVRL